MRKLLLSTIIVLGLLGLTNCSSASITGASTAASTLSAYLDALANKDEDKMTKLVCPDWQSDALIELDAFQAVETSLEGLSCSQTGSENQAALVSCQGKIMAKYVDQTQEFDLSDRVYRLEKKGADWLVCGYSMK